MLDVPTNQDWTPKTSWTTTTTRHSIIEMRAHFHGLCGGISQKKQRLWFHLGDSWPIDEVSTFLTHSDILLIKPIGYFILMRLCNGTVFKLVLSLIETHGLLLIFWEDYRKLWARNWNSTLLPPPPDWWAIGKNHTNIWRHVPRLCDWFQWKLRYLLPIKFA